MNTVLALLRREPQAAEQALENLSELYRGLLRDPQEHVTLAEEIALCRQYIDLEKLRLGRRLQMDWKISAAPEDLLVPPLILQPLLENAVYHGIEPLPEGGCICMEMRKLGDYLNIEICNPISATLTQRASDKFKHEVSTKGVGSGHQMAISNVRERLALFYDLEASIQSGMKGTLYYLKISLPWQTRAKIAA